jgi:hypothetical protein
VRLVGRDGAILTRLPSHESPLTIYCGYGLYEFSVADPGRFHVGQGVLLTDDHAAGFYETTATIVGRDGDRFFVDTPFHHDYHPDNNGRVIALFPVVSGVGVERAGVSGLALDGNPEETRPLNGCRGGGIFLLRSRRIDLEGVEVRHFRGDGISFQQCVDVAARGCRVHHNSGAGLHPGSGSVRYLLEENDLHDNGGCGIFYCLRTTHSYCRGNRIARNGDAGISIGEMDTDHLVAGNEIRDNRGHGIHFRRPSCIGGDRVRVEGNRFGRNGTGEDARSIHVSERLSDIAIENNTFASGETPPVFFGPGCRQVTFAGNRIGERDATPADIEGDREPIGRPEGEKFPAVGPPALPLDGARHLGIPRLWPWETGINGVRE